MTVRLSSGASANILDFRIRQKHVLPVRIAVKGGGGTGPERVNRAAAVAGRGAIVRERALAVFDHAARKNPPRAESVGSMTFDIRPTANPTSDKDRAAKLVDPGFGRVFTDHMAIVRYSTAKGWHDARIESRANFPLDPALAVLHYAQEI